MSVETSVPQHHMRQPKTHCGTKAWSCSMNIFKRLALRKQMNIIQVEIDTENDLSRSVTSLQLIGLGVGGIIGEYD